MIQGSADTLSATERLYRARRIGTTFGRTYLGIRANRFIARRLKPPDMQQRWSQLHRTNARSIYATAVELRGLILKGCQFLGSRADVLPPEYVEVLSKLQDRVPPKPFGVVRRTVERELGRDLDRVFTRFSRRPIASASLAQVHDATLRDGRRVAVKVQYPEIESLVLSDLANLRVLFRAVGYLEPDVDLMALIDELAIQVPMELDFIREGRNAETIASFFEAREDVGVPTIHWDVSTRQVLVMDFVEGIKISDIAALRRAAIDPGRVAQILLEAYGEQILARGFFHADPHPGNLLVQPGEHGPRVVFVDFGLTKELPRRFREGVVALIGALFQGNSEALSSALVELGFETRDGGERPLAEVAELLLEIAQELRAHSQLDRATLERVRTELPRRIRENPIVRVPSHLVLLARVIALLSGLNRTLETRVDLVGTILPYALGSHPPACGDEPPVSSRPRPLFG